MHSRTEGSTRINMDHHLVLIFRFYIFPGRYNQNIIYIELMKILLPVIYPVHIFCLGLLDHALAHIHIGRHISQLPTDICKHFFLIFFRFQIETQIGHAVIALNLRKNIHKHLLFICLCQRNLIFDFHSLNPQIHQHAADNIFSLCCCL